ncbi:hypothetical protein J6590_016550 [Homalodisca vitripennis]|nr:hypothetical protein J6590_016550 [Homalodisca vitripennis]
MLPEYSLTCRTGPVLVLRPSEEDLNETLVRRLEVQDEMDRRGTSAIYKPKVEEKPIYSNNRFERKPQAEDTPIMGAIPKQMTPPVPSSKPAAPPTKPAAPPTKPAEAAEVIIDYQAEMRAARLRMQQKYEESLKKQQGQAQ